MTYLDFSAYVYKNELKKVIDRENKEQDYLAAEHFTSYEERAAAGNAAACDQLNKLHALKIAEHRQEKHGEDAAAEIEEIAAGINGEYLEMLPQVEDPEYWLI